MILRNAFFIDFLLCGGVCKNKLYCLLLLSIESCPTGFSSVLYTQYIRLCIYRWSVCVLCACVYLINRHSLCERKQNVINWTFERFLPVRPHLHLWHVCLCVLYVAHFARHKSRSMVMIGRHSLDSICNFVCLNSFYPLSCL